MIDLGKGSFSATTIKINNVKVGKYCSIGPEVYFYDEGTHLAQFNHDCVFTINWFQTGDSRPIVIGNDVWIGREAKILDGVKIGNGAIIGAWTVVTKDVPAYCVVVGNPARVVRARFTPTQQEKLEKIKWWDWSSKEIDERREDMKDINIFIQKYG